MSFQMIDAQTLKVLYVDIKNPGKNKEWKYTFLYVSRAMDKELKGNLTFMEFI